MSGKIFASPMEKAIYIAGGQSALAKKIGVTQGAVWKWVRGLKNISPIHVVAVCEAVGGAVEAHELRPDLPTLFPHPSVAKHDKQ
ncbi:helix-turn-helix domain-containing protein [Rouxiella badensis]|uniref:transcriptional regulator n=1 Tax=Rouxiella badensis TaxID=1646377 RepID=UPI0013EEF1A2|nr:YdaS family helix-turn-helix protein [Rouxiella badensis]QII37489.1 helix-turn-helix domain-containing protein [Rouxiella badensis]